MINAPRTKCLPELPDNSRVWVGTPNGQIPRRVISAGPEPRSYRVSVSSGEARRNHLHLRERANSSDPDVVVVRPQDKYRLVLRLEPVFNLQIITCSILELRGRCSMTEHCVIANI